MSEREKTQSRVREHGPDRARNSEDIYAHFAKSHPNAIASLCNPAEWLF